MSVNEEAFEMDFFCDVDHEKHVLCELKKLQLKEKFCDAVVISGIDAKRINVHRNVLSASNDFFASLFASSTPENKINEFIIQEIDGKMLENFVNFCYTGKIELKMQEAENVLMAAKKMKFAKVFDASVDFISKQINLKNFMEISTLTERLNCKKLEENVFEFLKRNFLEISKSEHFKQMTSSKLSQLIGSNELNVTSEEDIFNAVMFWVNFEAENRKKFIAGLLGLLKMSRLSTEFINKNVRPVCDANGCHQLYLDTLLSQLSTNVKESVTTPKDSQPTIINEDVIASKDLPTTTNLLAVGWDRVKGCTQILKYSIEHDYWLVLHKVSHFGVLHSSCLWNEKVFLIINSGIICINLQTGKTEPFENFEKLRDGACVTAFQECIYVMGGNKRSVEKWDSKTEKWSQSADMKKPKGEFATIVFNDLIYVIGGQSNGYYIKETEYFDPQKNIWVEVAPMNSIRALPGVAADERYIYVVGGQSNGNWLKSIERYDHQINKWSMMSISLCEVRRNFGCVFFNEFIYAIGGTESNTVEIVNTKTGKWTYKNSLPFNFKKCAVFLSNSNNF